MVNIKGRFTMNNERNTVSLQLKYIPLGEGRGGYYQLIDWRGRIYFEGTGLEAMDWLEKEGFKSADLDSLPEGLPSWMAAWFFTKELYIYTPELDKDC